MMYRVLAVLVFLTASLDAQQKPRADTTIQIGGVDMSIGMSQDDALTPLAHLYDVRHQDNLPGFWTVVRRGGPPYEIIGSLSFGDGRLVAATKTWGQPKERTAQGHAAAMFDALRAITNGSVKSCAVEVDPRPQVRSSLITCGLRTVHVYSPMNSDYEATVDETIHK